MGLGVLYAVAAGLMWAGGGALLSRVVRRGKDPIAFVALSSFVSVPALWLLVPNYDVIGSGEIPRLSELILYMALGGLSVGLAQLALQAAMKKGHHGATWTINNASLVIPFVFGVAFWADQPGASNIVGVAMIVGALVCLGMATERDEHTGRSRLQMGWFLLAMTAFVLTGMEQIAKSVPSQWAGWEDVGRLRAPLALSASTIVLQVVAIVGRRYTRDAPWTEALVMGCLMVPSHFLVYLAIDIFAAEDLTGLGYPMAVCACLLGFAVYSLVVLKERLTPLRGVGLAMGIVGVVLVPVTAESWRALGQMMKAWLT